MFTKNSDVEHHIKVFLLFKNSKIPNIPQQVKKDFIESDKNIISFYQKDKVIVLVSIQKDNLEKRIKETKKYLENYPKKIALFYPAKSNLEQQIQLINESYYEFDYKTQKSKKSNKKTKKAKNPEKEKNPKKGKKPKFYIYIKNKKINSKNQEIMASSIELLKKLGDEPSNILTPIEYIKRIKEVCKEANLELDIMGPRELKKLGMNSILAVSQGSDFGGYLVKISHLPVKDKPIVMVGKGITFDSGGISLKKYRKMYEMKGDMIGSAIVLATMRNIGLMNIKENVIGLLAIAENMPDSKAIKPGDVVKSYSGKTIEIRNTDAEGRLVVADALSYGLEFEPKLIVDVATLTGQQWNISCGLFGSILGHQDKTIKKFLEIGKKTDDILVEMPLLQKFIEHNRSKIADVKNAEYKCKGASLGNSGAFLSHFVDKDSNWVHLDVAGPTFKKGRTQSFGIKLLTEVIKGNHF